jgi:hypothetical protein
MKLTSFEKNCHILRRSLSNNIVVRRISCESKCMAYNSNKNVEFKWSAHDSGSDWN